MTIRDQDLQSCAARARTLWLDSYPSVPPPHTFSPDFERRMQTMIHRRRFSLKTLLLVALLAALLGTLTIQAIDGPLSRFIRTQSSDQATIRYPDPEPVTDAPVVPDDHHLLHTESPDGGAGQADLWHNACVLYTGEWQAAAYTSGCTDHNDAAHTVVTEVRHTITALECSICSGPLQQVTSETRQRCLGNDAVPDLCPSHTAEETIDNPAGWTVLSTACTEWIYDLTLCADSHSPCLAHRRMDHLEQQDLRYLITDYQCPDCPLVCTVITPERRTACLYRSPSTGALILYQNNPEDMTIYRRKD